jgi:D-glycero-D-manno-heptose 1,7-bisphosphate phosphatase
MRKRRAVFLDRDGTLNRDIGYPGHWGQVHVYPYAFEAVRRIRAAGLAVVVVTNQSGVGRNCFSEDDLRELHREFGAAFEKQGAGLDGFFYCPHDSRPAAAAPAARCSCAKPAPLLGLRAAAELGLTLEGSYMVGDKADDVRFGLNIGAVPILVLTGYGRKALRDLETGRVRPAHVAEDLAAAADWIIEREKQAARISRDHASRKRSGHDPV